MPLSLALLCVRCARGMLWVFCWRPSDPQPGETILDMCAAPGGKTTGIAILMGDKGRVIALDRTHAKVTWGDEITSPCSHHHLHLPLYGCIVALVHNSTVVLVHGSTVARLHCCTIVRLYGFPVVLQVEEVTRRALEMGLRTITAFKMDATKAVLDAPCICCLGTVTSHKSQRGAPSHNADAPPTTAPNSIANSTVQVGGSGVANGSMLATGAPHSTVQPLANGSLPQTGPYLHTDNQTNSACTNGTGADHTGGSVGCAGGALEPEPRVYQSQAGVSVGNAAGAPQPGPYQPQSAEGLGHAGGAPKLGVHQRQAGESAGNAGSAPGGGVYQSQAAARKATRQAKNGRHQRPASEPGPVCPGCAAGRRPDPSRGTLREPAEDGKSCPWDGLPEGEASAEPSAEGEREGLPPQAPKAFTPQSFDRVLLDGPCSALGLRPRLFAGNVSLPLSHWPHLSPAAPTCPSLLLWRFRCLPFNSLLGD